MSVSADDFLYQLNNLPPDTNPFLWMSNLFKSQYLPQYSQSVKAQLYVNIGLDSLTLVNLVAALVIRFRKKQFWFFRRRGRLIMPNLYTISGCLGTGLSFLIIVLLLGMIKTVDGDLPTYIGPFSLLIGFIPPLVGAIVVWSLAASFLLHSQSLRGPGTHSLDHWITPCNLLGIIPILHLLAFIPLDAVAGVRYVSAILLYRSIDAFLLSQASIWDPTSTFNVSNLLRIAPKFIALESEFSSLVPIWRGTYIFNAIAAVVLVISLTTISSLYLSSIGRLVQKGKEAQLHNSSGQKPDLLDEVKRRWIGLVIGMALFDVIAAFAFALSVFASKRPLEMAETYILTSFWSTTILSFLAGGVFLWLSWVLRPELDEAERENQRNREEKADEERGLDQLASKRYWPFARKFAKEVHPSLVQDKHQNPYLNGKESHPLTHLDKIAKKAKEDEQFKRRSLDPSEPGYYNTDEGIQRFKSRQPAEQLIDASQRRRQAAMRDLDEKFSNRGAQQGKQQTSHHRKV